MEKYNKQKIEIRNQIEQSNKIAYKLNIYTKI